MIAVIVRYAAVILLWVGVFFGLVRAQGNSSTICSGFTMTTDTGTRLDSTEGFVYYADGRVIFRVHYPVDQWLVVQENEVSIFYPRSRRAFVLTSEGVVVLPLVTGLLASTRPDYGLGMIGFRLADQQMTGDTLVTFWTNDRRGGRPGKFQLAHVGGRLAYCLYDDPTNDVRTRTSFGSYVTTSSINLPQSMLTELWTNGRRSYEKVELRDLRINVPLPADVRYFTIPADAIVERKDW